MKIRPVGAEYFHADRRTDMTKTVFAFRHNFANSPKKTNQKKGKVKKRTKNNIYAIEVST
jgi:hypothetical protein